MLSEKCIEEIKKHLRPFSRSGRVTSNMGRLKLYDGVSLTGHRFKFNFETRSDASINLFVADLPKGNELYEVMIEATVRIPMSEEQIKERNQKLVVNGRRDLIRNFNLTYIVPRSILQLKYDLVNSQQLASICEDIALEELNMLKKWYGDGNYDFRLQN